MFSLVSSRKVYKACSGLVFIIGDLVMFESKEERYEIVKELVPKIIETDFLLDKYVFLGLQINPSVWKLADVVERKKLKSYDTLKGEKNHESNRN